MWYSGTFSCGHDGKVGIIGPMKDRRWRADKKFEGLCPECYEKHLKEEREKANSEALEKAKEMELPELQGTEKQVAWANSIRQKFIDKLDNINEDEIQKYSTWGDLKDLKGKEVSEIADYILKEKVKASYWIDNRGEVIALLVVERGNAIKTDKEKMEEQALKEIKIESVTYPENKITDAIVEIKVASNKVSALFEKNEEFIKIIKSLGYKWTGAWEKNITEFTGSAEDRAAELGNKLLNAGFPVCILDESIRTNAINGTFEPECNRWIRIRTAGTYKGCFAIKWWERNEKLYERAKSLPGAHWSDGCMVLKIMHYKEVEDFANLYGFKFSIAAKKAIEEYKEKAKKIEVVNPVTAEKEVHSDGLKEILNSGSDILDDLKD